MKIIISGSPKVCYKSYNSFESLKGNIPRQIQSKYQQQFIPQLCDYFNIELKV